LPVRDAGALAQDVAAMDPWATYGVPAAAIAAYLAGGEPDGLRYQLNVDGAVAGAFGLQPNRLRGPYIRFLALLPPFQRRGIGSALLAWLEQEARGRQERNLWVVASQINADGIRFYERHGFVLAATLDDLAYDGRVELLFRKRL
jgi:diamine N-acetyltransferase